MEIKEYIDYGVMALIVIMLGIAIVLLYKVLRSLKETTERTIDIIDELRESNRQSEEERQIEYRAKLLKDCKEALRALDSQNVYDIKEAPKKPSLDTEQLVAAFNVYERKQIDEAFSCFNSYLRDNWLTPDGDFVTGLNKDAKVIARSESDYPVMLFKEIVELIQG